MTWRVTLGQSGRRFSNRVMVVTVSYAVSAAQAARAAQRDCPGWTALVAERES